MIELSKVPEESDGKAVWDWMKFLRGKRKEDFEMIAERNSEVKGAVNTLYRLSENPEVRARMEYCEKTRGDHATLLHAAVEEGEARGKALGETQSCAEIARNMKNPGLTPEMIEKATCPGPKPLNSFNPPARYHEALCKAAECVAPKQSGHGGPFAGLHRFVRNAGHPVRAYLFYHI
jgi:hypothetical protein